MIRKLIPIIALFVLVSITLVQPVAAQNPVWIAQYYSNATLSGTPVLTRNDANIAFNWGLSSPAVEVPADTFSVRWGTDVALNAGTYRFYALADDNIRVTFHFGLTPIIDTFTTPSVGTVVSADVTVPEAGNYHIQVDYREQTENAYAFFSFANLNTNPTGPNFATPADVPVNTASWTAQYYNNPNLEGAPAAILSENHPSHYWGTDAPQPSVPADNWSARWTSVQNLPAGSYRVRVRADDGFRVFINGVLVINQWAGATGQTYTAEVSLPAGNNNFQIDFFDLTADAFLDYTLNSLNAGSPSPQATVAPTGTVATVTAYRLNVRNAPDAINGAVIARINRNEQYQVIGQNVDGTWVQLDVGGNPGWVNVRFVNVSGAIPTTPVPAGGITATATPYTVNIRSGAGTQFGRIAQLRVNESAIVVGRNANNTWYQINYNGIVGWVTAQYVQLSAGANVNSLPVTG